MSNNEIQITRSHVGIITGPRGRPGSQRPRPQRDAQINSVVPMHWDALRAETDSRSVPVVKAHHVGGGNRMRPNPSSMRPRVISSFGFRASLDIRHSAFVIRT
jgi:hypothetical protein